MENNASSEVSAVPTVEVTAPVVVQAPVAVVTPKIKRKANRKPKNKNTELMPIHDALQEIINAEVEKRVAEIRKTLSSIKI
jgi:hypothetical protein